MVELLGGGVGPCRPGEVHLDTSLAVAMGGWSRAGLVGVLEGNKWELNHMAIIYRYYKPIEVGSYMYSMLVL